ncbi:hypothetical protein [Tropicimonas sp. S265A]|uniref:hypothetical protein n=1 Tax=Tropicimonas sp. S265A TaxID=3415134 RepID=UPI003C7C9751
MAEDITWYGESGRAYTFKCYPDGQQFNPVSAVYILCSKQSPGVMQALYVGEAQSLQQRLNTGVSSHKGYARARDLGMTHIGVRVAASEQERLSVENDLRRGMRPPANLQGVG